MKEFTIKKLYYSISEVSKITGLEPYILRYWETEFEQLKPAKNRAGNRIYTNRDIKIIFQIKRLREEGYTIEGVKKILKSYNPDEDPTEISNEDGGKIRISYISGPELRKILAEIKQTLEQIYKLL